MFSFPNVDNCVHCFTLVLQGLLDFLVPLCWLCVRNGGSDPWLTTPCIIAARRLRDRLHRKALRTGCSEDWFKFRQSRNKYTSLLRSAKRAYVLYLAANRTTQPVNFWKYVGRFTKRKGLDNPMLESSLTADDFNAHFLSIAQKSISTLPVSELSLDPLSFCGSKPVPPFELHEVTDSQVTTLIELMDPKKAKGEDGFPVQFSRACPSGMACYSI